MEISTLNLIFQVNLHKLHCFLLLINLFSFFLTTENSSLGNFYNFFKLDPDRLFKSRWIRIHIEKYCWMRIRIRKKLMRIHSPDQELCFVLSRHSVSGSRDVTSDSYAGKHGG